MSPLRHQLTEYESELLGRLAEVASQRRHLDRNFGILIRLLAKEGVPQRVIGRAAGISNVAVHHRLKKQRQEVGR